MDVDQLLDDNTVGAQVPECSRPVSKPSRGPSTGAFGASEDPVRAGLSGSVNQTLGHSGKPVTGVRNRGGVVGRPAT